VAFGAFGLEFIIDYPLEKEIVMSKIPAVQATDYGRIEGVVADMGWIMA
jgi:hypothetical protein